MSIEPGVLYVVATPIGNLEDITHRALTVLGGVDRIAAEDTRRTRILLQHYGLDRPLMAVHEHNERQVVAGLLDRLAAGESLALVSDAGTPLISDPGYRLVRQARERGMQVVPVPGPSAVLAALSASGLATDRFRFEGFLPAKATARAERLQVLAAETETLVFFESSHRIIASLAAMTEAFGAGREAVLAKEITKRFETFRHGTLHELRNWVAAEDARRRGEFVVLVAGRNTADEAQDEAEMVRLLDILLQDLPVKRAAAVVAEITGFKRNAVYQAALQRSRLQNQK